MRTGASGYPRTRRAPPRARPATTSDASVLSYSSGRKKSATRALNITSIGDGALHRCLGRRFFTRCRKALARFPHLTVERGLVRVARRRGREGRRRRLRYRRGRARWLFQVLVGVQELLAELVRRAAQLANDAADIARHSR